MNLTLVEILRSALRRPAVEVWLSSEEGVALNEVDRHPVQACILVGRMIRAGDISRDQNEALRRWLIAYCAQTSALLSPISEAANAFLDQLCSALAGRSFDIPRLLRRDDLESLLCFLAHAALAGLEGASTIERRLLQRAAEVDGGVARDGWSFELAPLKDRDAWLTHIADLEASTWWLDLYSLLSIRDKLGKSALLSLPAKTALPPLHLRGMLPNRPSSGAEVVGCDSVPPLQAIQETLVARLFSDQVEVLAVHAADRRHSLLLGLRLRWMGSRCNGITAVTVHHSDQPDSLASPPSPRETVEWWIDITHLMNATGIQARCRLGHEEHEVGLPLRVSLAKA